MVFDVTHLGLHTLLATVTRNHFCSTPIRAHVCSHSPPCLIYLSPGTGSAPLPLEFPPIVTTSPQTQRNLSYHPALLIPFSTPTSTTKPWALSTGQPPVSATYHCPLSCCPKPLEHQDSYEIPALPLTSWAVTALLWASVSLFLTWEDKTSSQSSRSEQRMAMELLCISYGYCF